MSTESVNPRDKERQYQIERAFLLDKSSKATERLVKGMSGKTKLLAGVKSMGHIAPSALTAKINDNIREDKLQEKEIC